MTTPTSRRTRMAALAATLALAAAGGGFAIVTSTAASAATAVTGQITGLAGKCIGAAGGNTANGTAIDLYSCVGDATQQWTLPGDGTIRTAGKCMDVSGAGTADGTKVQIYDCNGTAAQQWVYTSARELVNPNADKCLDLKGNSSADLTVTQLWTCTGAANQQWTVPTGTAPGGPSAGTTISVLLTGYGWWDNTPPGSAEISNPVIHQQAGGTGTYADPITVAVPYHCDNGCLHWPAGTRFYLPSLQRYLIVEDTCGDGGPDTCPDSTGNHLDVWVGGQSLTHAQSDACEESITGNTTAILGPDANRTVTAGDICR